MLRYDFDIIHVYTLNAIQYKSNFVRISYLFLITLSVIHVTLTSVKDSATLMLNA